LEQAVAEDITGQIAAAMAAEWYGLIIFQLYQDNHIVFKLVEAVAGAAIQAAVHAGQE
jgi:hypothetical protein